MREVIKLPGCVSRPPLQFFIPSFFQSCNRQSFSYKKLYKFYSYFYTIREFPSPSNSGTPSPGGSSREGLFPFTNAGVESYITQVDRQTDLESFVEQVEVKTEPSFITSSLLKYCWGTTKTSKEIKQDFQAWGQARIPDDTMTQERLIWRTKDDEIRANFMIQQNPSSEVSNERVGHLLWKGFWRLTLQEKAITVIFLPLPRLVFTAHPRQITVPTPPLQLTVDWVAPYGPNLLQSGDWMSTHCALWS